jgi:cell division protein FtsI/penicillin-binding protein 2
MIGKKLGKEGLDRYLRAFGLGAQTGLRFPGESPGLLLDPDKWSGTSMATVPMGQGMAVTALQMLAAYNVIANNGTYVPPKLVTSVVDAAGKHHDPEYPDDRRVVSEATAAQMTPILEEVVTTGTGKPAAVEGYRVAGKTGTAQKTREGVPGYQPGAYVATFAGFFPASSPRLSAIVVLDEPTPYYGGLASGPVFSRIAAFGGRLFKVPGDAPVAPATVTAKATASTSEEPASGTTNLTKAQQGTD